MRTTGTAWAVLISMAAALRQPPTAAPPRPCHPRRRASMTSMVNLGRLDKLVLAIGALMLAAHVAATLLFPKPNGRVVFGDATHHFVQLRSMVFDRDFD